MAWILRNARKLMVGAGGVLLCATALPASPAAAVTPGRNGLIAYAYFDILGSDGGIYTVDPTTNHATELVNDPNATAPAWSPNGQQIAYGTGISIKIVTASGIPVRTMITHGGSPTWSGDGRTLAYIRGNSIYTIPAAGGNSRRLTVPPQGCGDTSPRWSPIGASLVFQRLCGTQHAIYIVSVQTAKLHLVTRDGALDPRNVIGGADFVPNGKRVILTATCYAKGKCLGGANRVVTVNLNGGDWVSLTRETMSCDPNLYNCDAYTSVHAAPNGKTFTYDIGTNGGDCVLAWKTTVSQCSNADNPDWQPLHP
jgi:Tol biopolymer transport system component